jgi:hypothetical protein
MRDRQPKFPAQPLNRALSGMPEAHLIQLLTPEALSERLRCAGNHESCVVRRQNMVLFGKPLKQD